MEVICVQSDFKDPVMWITVLLYSAPSVTGSLEHSSNETRIVMEDLWRPVRCTQSCCHNLSLKAGQSTLMVDDQKQIAEVYGGIEAHGDGVEAQNTGFAELIQKYCM